MRIETLKPLHGWRVFTGEVGVIVLGVLIALGAQQLAESIRVRNETRAAMNTIHHELSQLAGVFDERNLVQPCLDRRLEEIDSLVRAARFSGHLPRIGEIGRPPMRPIQTSGWTTAISSAMTVHFDGESLNQLASLYPQIIPYEEDVIEEQRLWATLQALENAPGPPSDGLLTQASVAIAQLKFRSMLNGLNSSQVTEALHTTGIVPDYSIVLDGSGPRAEVVKSVAERPVCKPLAVDGKSYSIAA